MIKLYEIIALEENTTNTFCLLVPAINQKKALEFFATYGNGYEIIRIKESKEKYLSSKCIASALQKSNFGNTEILIMERLCSLCDFMYVD